MAARTDSKIPWLPLVILILGVVIFWIIPLAQPDPQLNATPAAGSNK